MCLSGVDISHPTWTQAKLMIKLELPQNAPYHCKYWFKSL